MTNPETAARRRWGLAATSLGFAVVQLDVSVVNVAIRSIGESLGGSVAALQWVVNAYTIAFAALILTAGALGDRVGAKRVFLGGFAVFTAASAACGLAPSLVALVIARAVQGVGAAALVPCSLALLTHAYPDAADRARAVGTWAAGASVALSAGPLVGGVLTAAIGWRAIFFINVPIGLAAIVICVRYSTETSRSEERRLDLPGAIVAAAALTVVAWAVISGGQVGFGRPEVLVSVIAGVLLIGAFLAVEARRREPMLPLRLFRSPAFSAASSVGLLVNIAFYGLIFVLSLFFQQDQHLSALATGLAFAPMTIAVLVANLLAGRFVTRFGGGPVILVGAVLMVLGTVPLLSTQTSTPFLPLIAPFVALGAGLGLVVPAMTSALLASVDASRAGVASGTLNTARQTGSVLGVAVLGALGGGSLTLGLHLASGTTIVLVALTAVGALVLRRSEPVKRS